MHSQVAGANRIDLEYRNDAANNRMQMGHPVRDVNSLAADARHRVAACPVPASVVLPIQTVDALTDQIRLLIPSGRQVPVATEFRIAVL